MRTIFANHRVRGARTKDFEWLQKVPEEHRAEFLEKRGLQEKRGRRLAGKQPATAIIEPVHKAAKIAPGLLPLEGDHVLH